MIPSDDSRTLPSLPNDDGRCSGDSMVGVRRRIRETTTRLPYPCDPRIKQALDMPRPLSPVESAPRIPPRCHEINS